MLSYRPFLCGVQGCRGAPLTGALVALCLVFFFEGGVATKAST